MSVRNYFLWFIDNSKIHILVPSTFLSRNLPSYHPKAILNTHIIWTKIANMQWPFMWTSVWDLQKTKKSSHQRKQNTWRQFPSQLCVEANAAQIMHHQDLFLKRSFVHNLEQNLDYRAWWEYFIWGNCGWVNNW